jgi:hypothetical protein
MEFIWFMLSAAGLTQILVYGSIFNKIRPKHEVLGGLFHCTMCMGSWVGALLCGISPYTELFTFDQTLANFLICGWLSSGTSYVFGQTFGDEGINVKRT